MAAVSIIYENTQQVCTTMGACPAEASSFTSSEPGMSVSSFQSVPLCLTKENLHFVHMWNHFCPQLISHSCTYQINQLLRIYFSNHLPHLGPVLGGLLLDLNHAFLHLHVRAAGVQRLGQILVPENKQHAD